MPHSLTSNKAEVMEQSRGIFLHMEKCAGQSINQWLAEIHGTNWVSPNLIGNHREIIRTYGGAYSWLSGHVEFDGTGLDPRYRYITVLRDPIDRLISWVNFVLSVEFPTDYIRSLQEGAEIFLRSNGQDTTPIFYQTISNPYCRRLSRALSTAIVDTSSQLDAALHVLEQFFLVGSFENLESFCNKYIFSQNISEKHIIPHVNKTSKKRIDTIDDNFRMQCANYVRSDILLYQKFCLNNDHLYSNLDTNSSAKGLITSFNWNTPSHPVRPYWEDETLLAYRGANLTCQVGTNVGMFREADGRFGFLSLGPYIPMIAGTYDVAITGEWGSRGGIYIVECHDLSSGKTVGTGYIIDWGSPDLNFFAPISFVVPEALENCEIRVLVPASHKITIHNIMIARNKEPKKDKKQISITDTKEPPVNYARVENDMVGYLLSDKTIMSTYRAGVLCIIDIQDAELSSARTESRVLVQITGSVGPNGLAAATIRATLGADILTTAIEFTPAFESGSFFIFQKIFHIGSVLNAPIFEIIVSENTELHLFNVKCLMQY
ncbi:sulfotransferase family 2 domain-containing protein [Acidithiobacillus thiooxidans]|uniref:Sulfotransferase domain-containing protein n=1 Tax=Acidithiobacillus thiooxidans ATCC 19377 TaxID=637390 RepID=A0A543Q578_ACITH|nr:sulfotransferase family 2 domain-containing protein [Acidithiobacillus thiooxidans]MDX5934399.1 sulfotransferase family 2 domain-containing protein [Acidithiobacillus thiooxidans]TQN51486.1 hypothetical protein DLNHIDIE_01359 [Acidithiobacillus thiooxidans ATCC 19377]